MEAQLFLAWKPELSKHLRQLESQYDFLDPEELARLAVLSAERRKLEFISSRAFLHFLKETGHILENSFTSLSHSKGHVLIGRSDRSKIGVDLEDLSRFQPGQIRKVLHSSETKNLDSWGARLMLKSEEIIGILFSAKESIYKSTIPQQQESLSFRGVEIELLTETRNFSAKQALHSERKWEGAWEIRKDPDGREFVLSVARQTHGFD